MSKEKPGLGVQDNYVGRWVVGEPQDNCLSHSVGRYGKHDLEEIGASYVRLLQLEKHHELLDVCCGNGLITRIFAKQCTRTTALDFSKELINQARRISDEFKIDYNEGDLKRLDEVLQDRKFDRISMIAALQHFSPDDVMQILLQFDKVLKLEGVVLISDIPDKALKRAHRSHALKRLVGLKNDRTWASIGEKMRYIKRQLLHFASKAVTTTQGDDRLGWWWTRDEFIEAASRAGFTCRCYDQPTVNPHHFYRFDAVLTRLSGKSDAL